MDNSWAKPGVKCVPRTGPENWFVLRTGEPADGPFWRDVHEVVCVKVIDDTVVLGLRGDVLDSYWRASDFRPLISKTQEQDAELFKHLLTDIPDDETLSAELALDAAQGRVWP